MSDFVTFTPLSVADIFGLGDVAVYQYGEDLVLTTSSLCDIECLLHLYENEMDDRTIYGLNRGQPFRSAEPPAFIGTPAAVEVLYAADDKNWDFGSLTLKAKDGSILQIDRNDDSFPEPTLKVRDF